jgi:peptidoglycan/xylan/chitin deacetylase (PgdA/CDA1 family)
MLTLPILTFHSLDDQRNVISFSPGVFRRAMGKLHENGYRTLNLTDAAIKICQKRPLPDRSFAITFDDGYQSVYEQALPVLRKYAMCATVFLTVGETATAESTSRLPALSGRSMLSWGEIREMANYGFTFGAHTLTHPDLTRLPTEKVAAEIGRSKTIIEERLGSLVTCFAYPYGRYDRRSREIVRHHFGCACSDKLGLTTKDSDLYALERVDAYYLRSDRLFDVMLTERFPWYIFACSVPRRIRRAISFRIM